MYNEAFKKRFIVYKESMSVMAPNLMQILFTKSQPYEEALGKDLYDFNRDEIIDFYNYVGYVSLSTYRYLNSLLSTYNQFAFVNGLVADGQNHYLEITGDDLIGCIDRRTVNHSIVTRDELVQIVNKLENARDKFLLLSLFEFGGGKQFSDILNIKAEDIDQKNKKLSLSDRTVDVTQFWIDNALLADSTLTFIPYDDNDRYELTLVDMGYIFKHSTRTREASPAQICRRLSQMYRKLREYVGFPESMTTKSITTSGKIDMVKRRSKELEISAETYCRNYQHEIERQYGVRFAPSAFLLEFKSYL